MKQEELQKYADKLAQEYFPNEMNIWARENIEAQFVEDACMRMARYVEQELIKKACEWMRTHIKVETASYADIWDQSDVDLLMADFTTVDEMEESFRKAIEE
jgi:hypothetical protein